MVAKCHDLFTERNYWPIAKADPPRKALLYLTWRDVPLSRVSFCGKFLRQGVFFRERLCIKVLQLIKSYATGYLVEMKSFRILWNNRLCTLLAKFYVWISFPYTPASSLFWYTPPGLGHFIIPSAIHDTFLNPIANH